MQTLLVTLGIFTAAELVFWLARGAWEKKNLSRLASKSTTPPGRFLVLYDGHCRFCTTQMKNLQRLGKQNALIPHDFQQAESLSVLPGIPYDACMRAMHLVTPEGRVYEGASAVMQAVSTRPALSWLWYAYHLPGIHLSTNLVYAIIAANRYRIAGKAVAAGECDGGSCQLHFGPKQ